MGESLKAIQASDSAWILSDPRIAAQIERGSTGDRAPARIYKRINVPEKRPWIEVVGDDSDIDYAKAVLIRVGYTNFDKMGINKMDFLSELKGRWGDPHHTSIVDGTERYLWLDRSTGVLGELTFDVGDWGPRMNLVISAAHIGNQSLRYSKEKAKDVLR